jgi:3-deoxy-D-arabino-heptulosonate 7-phosphate (DAHP) synthase
MTPPLNITPLKSWLPFDVPPLIVSGPCSAESEKQVCLTAEAREDPSSESFPCGHLETPYTAWFL